MATYLFRYKVKKMKQDMGVDFSKNLYQPEQCASTVEFIHEREDHNHVLKRITECLCSGEIPGVDVRHFVEALHDAESGELITIQFCTLHDLPVHHMYMSH